MSSPTISRKNFLKTSSILLAGGSSFLSGSTGHAREQRTPPDVTDTLRLKNVRLETGFEYMGEDIVGTTTDLFLIEITGGMITAVSANDPKAQALDGRGLLMLPAFRDMHIHLDKTFYGGPWKARSTKNRTVKDIIAYEQQVLPELLPTSTYRAGKLIELLQSRGSHFARSHVNIEPTSGLNSLKNLQKALDSKRHSFGAELVAFPQHGIFYTKTAPLLKEAAQMGVDFIGGLDPQAVDGDMEKSVDFIVQLALEHHKGIDIHLHQSGDAGLKTVAYLLSKVMENPVLKGKTYISHGFVLAHLDQSRLEEIAAQLAEAKVGIVSTIPFGSTIMPIPTLFKHGVEVLTGNDSIIDHWNTFGSGSVLQKANLAAQLYGYTSEWALSRCLRLATGNITPLDDKGVRQWPRTGDKANVVLVEASCSAEAVARISPVRSLIHEGRLVYENAAV